MTILLTIYFTINVFMAGFYMGDPFENNKIAKGVLLVLFGCLVVVCAYFWEWFSKTSLFNLLYSISMHIYYEPKLDNDEGETI
jgi:hypothetical protein